MIIGIIAAQLLSISAGASPGDPSETSATTWSPDNTIGFGGSPGTAVFSDGNRTTTVSGGSGVIASPATYARSTGKHYFEVLFVGGPASNANYVVGLARTNISVAPPGNDGGGSGGQSIGIRSDGAVFWFGFQQFTLATSLIGQRLGVAVDLDEKLLWARVNENDWNNGPTTDPATSTGGFHYEDTVGTEMIPIHGNVDDGQITGCFIASDHVYAPPSGFAPWSAF